MCIIVTIYLQMHPNFIYLNWEPKNRNSNLEFRDDQVGTVRVRTSAGVYKNNYADVVMDKHSVYYWEIKIIKGTAFKIGVIKQS
jgi:hypothetical protein